MHLIFKYSYLKNLHLTCLHFYSAHLKRNCNCLCLFFAVHEFYAYEALISYAGYILYSIDKQIFFAALETFANLIKVFTTLGLATPQL